MKSKLAKQKKSARALETKLYDNSSLCHPDNRSDKLIELLMSCMILLIFPLRSCFSHLQATSPKIASESITRMEPIISALKKSYPEASRTLATLQTFNEKLQNTFAVIVFSLPDLTADPSLLAQTIESVSPSHRARGTEPTPHGFAEACGVLTPDSLCIQATLLVVAVIKKILRRTGRALGQLQKYQDEASESQLRICVSQLNAVLEYALPSAMKANPEDIFYKSPDDPEWVKLKNYYSIYVYGFFLLLLATHTFNRMMSVLLLTLLTRHGKRG